MMKKSATRTVALALALALAAGGVTTPAPDSVAAAKPKLAETASVNVGKVKKLKINKNGFTIKKVTATVENEAVAFASTTKTMVKVAGLAVGTTVVTTKIKATRNKVTKTYKYTTVVTVKDPSAQPSSTPAPTATAAPTASSAPTGSPSSAVTVTNQTELDNALRGGATNIVIGSSVANLSIQTAQYKNTDLTVNAPYANLVNYATFKSIKINTINSFTEYGSGNSITVDSNKAVALNVMTTSSVANLTLKPAGNATIHRVDARSGSITNLVVAANAKATVALSNTAFVNWLTQDAGAQVDLNLSGSSFVQSYALRGNGQATIAGSSSKRSILDLSDANTSARVNVYAVVLDKVLTKETTITNADYVVLNRTSVAISNLITKANGTTTYSSIAPLVQPTTKETIKLGVTDASLGNSYIEFYSATYVNLNDKQFNFQVRKGSSSGTVINSNQVAEYTGYTYTYRLYLNQALTEGTYYVTMSTSLNYVLSPVSFTIKGSGINFTLNNLTAGSKMGYTKVTGLDTSNLQYLVTSEATPGSGKTWSNFASDKEIPVQEDQYIHLRVKNTTTTTTATVCVSNAYVIKGEVERIAAAGTVGAVVSESYTDGDFSLTNLNTKRRWVEVKKLVDEAMGRVVVYENMGGNSSKLPNYSEFTKLYNQYTDTSKKLVVDVTYPDNLLVYEIGSDVTTPEMAISKIMSDSRIDKSFTGVTGAGETVTLKINGWYLVDEYFDSVYGNWYEATTTTVVGKSSYQLADDLYSEIQVRVEYDDQG